MIINTEIIHGKENIQELRKQAWNYVTGKNPDFSIDKMSSIQYKYFDCLVRTFTALYNNQIDKDKAKELDDIAFEEYEQSSQQAFDMLQCVLYVKKLKTRAIEIKDNVKDKDEFITNICQLLEDIAGLGVYTETICKKLNIPYSKEGELID